MRAYAAIMKVREQMDRARESQVRIRTCFFVGWGPVVFGGAFASGSALEASASAGAGSCESSGAVSESAAVAWGDERVGAAGEDERAGEVFAMILREVVVGGGVGWDT